MILLIDNYDSFVFNLARYVQELNVPVRVVRNDRISLEEISDMRPGGMILSPGPCTPNESGICMDAVRNFTGKIPMLGVCLGHQAIVAALGGKVIASSSPMHGRTSLIRHDGKSIFTGLPNPFRAGRYHSLLAEEETIPPGLKITARTEEEGFIMGVEHAQFPVYGVQFHPESILTESGHRILANFLGICGLETRNYVSRELGSAPEFPLSDGGSVLDPQPVFW